MSPPSGHLYPAIEGIAADDYGDCDPMTLNEDDLATPAGANPQPFHARTAAFGLFLAVSVLRDLIAQGGENVVPVLEDGAAMTLVGPDDKPRIGDSGCEPLPV